MFLKTLNDFSDQCYVCMCAKVNVRMYIFCSKILLQAYKVTKTLFPCLSLYFCIQYLYLNVHMYMNFCVCHTFLQTLCYRFAFNLTKQPKIQKIYIFYAIFQIFYTCSLYYLDQFKKKKKKTVICINVYQGKILFAQQIVYVFFPYFFIYFPFFCEMMFVLCWLAFLLHKRRKNILQMVKNAKKRSKTKNK